MVSSINSSLAAKSLRGDVFRVVHTSVNGGRHCCDGKNGIERPFKLMRGKSSSRYTCKLQFIPKKHQRISQHNSHGRGYSHRRHQRLVVAQCKPERKRRCRTRHERRLPQIWILLSSWPRYPPSRTAQDARMRSALLQQAVIRGAHGALDR